AELAEAVQKMLAKQPGDRYQTPGEVAVALSKVIAGQSAPREQRGWPRRLLLGGGAAVCALALIAFLLTSVVRSRGIVIKEVPGHPGVQMAGDERLPITAAVFSPKDKTILLVRKDGHLDLWDYASGRLRPLGTHLNMKAHVFAPDGRTLATAG